MAVVFLGDISRGGQANNIKLMHDLFSPIFKQAGVSCRTYVSDINHSDDQDEWFPIWRAALDNSDVSELDRLNLDGAVVLGFEMSQAMVEKLNTLNVRWVNAFIHPIRFGEDLFFHFETSFDHDSKGSLGSQVGLHLAANMISHRFNHTSGPKDGQSRLLILGQEPRDRSVYFDGEFKNLWSYREKIAQIASQYDKIYYKPHVAVTNKDVDAMIMDKFDAELVTGQSFYSCLVGLQINACCAVSSSTIHEAKYFNVDGVFLEPRAKRFGSVIEYGRTLSDGDFWGRQFLQMPESVDAISEAQVHIPPNFLRGLFRVC